VEAGSITITARTAGFIPMHIDTHQHFWHYNDSEYAWIDDSMASLRRDFLPADLKPELERTGFRGTVLVQVRQSLEETRWMLDLAAKHPFIVGVVGWVDLRSEDLREQLEIFATNPKFVGVRHIVQSEPDEEFLLRPEFLRGVSLLSAFGLVYDLLIYHRHLPVAIEFARKVPQLRIVLNHLAKPAIRDHILHPWSENIRELAKCPNVYCKLSGHVSEADWNKRKPEDIRPYLDVAFEAFGPDRLMIGSDWPVSTLAASYAQSMDVVKNYLERLSGEVHEKVLGGNAIRFYRLPVAASESTAKHASGKE
jgi:L-fuconolactonase